MEIISVSLSVAEACQSLEGALERLVDEVGPGRADRILFLPPLVASLSGLDAQQALRHRAQFSETKNRCIHMYNTHYTYFQLVIIVVIAPLRELLVLCSAFPDPS